MKMAYELSRKLNLSLLAFDNFSKKWRKIKCDFFETLEISKDVKKLQKTSILLYMLQL